MIKYFKHNASFYSKLFILSGFICALVSSLSVGETLWKGSYYHFLETSFVFYLSSIYLIVTCKINKYDRFWESIVLIILLCSMSTIVDEIFYDATKIEWNDLVRFITIVCFSFYKNYR